MARDVDKSKGVWVQVQIDILRLGHRVLRDRRTTTHCALVARAFGAQSMAIVGEKDPKLLETIKKVNQEWGGSFNVKTFFEIDDFLELHPFHKLVHLTMYGIPFQTKIEEITLSCIDNPLAVLIGGSKVPSQVYGLVDWNLSITRQPHSEVAALAIFLWELARESNTGVPEKFVNAIKEVIPSSRGKKVLDHRKLDMSPTINDI